MSRTAGGPSGEKALAAILDDARCTATAVEQLSAAQPLSLAAAYRIQAIALDARVSRGERVVGLKLGFTSEDKRRQMGVHEVISGWLTDAMRIEPGSCLDLAGFVHPRVEPEVAFLLAEDTEEDGAPGQADGCRLQLVAAAPALEVIDSRYRDFRFSLPDVVADNASAAAFVVGDWQPVPDNLRSAAVQLVFDGDIVAAAHADAILGDPVNALPAARQLFADTVSEAGNHMAPALAAGMVLMAGAATEAFPLAAGTEVHVVVEGLGRVGFTTGPVRSTAR